jgi:hypothetical protein
MCERKDTFFGLLVSGGHEGVEKCCEEERMFVDAIARMRSL